ncbi:MAG: Holliday junction resolvase RuvX, partial [Malacoplasma sp.]|nr:Holliday junction resolvase RuvX [Malacoplasma sp.]
FDESFSTKNSYSSLKNFKVKTSKLDKNKDMIAASIILENYLNSKTKSR